MGRKGALSGLPSLFRYWCGPSGPGDRGGGKPEDGDSGFRHQAHEAHTSSFNKSSAAALVNLALNDPGGVSSGSPAKFLLTNSTGMVSFARMLQAELTSAWELRNRMYEVGKGRRSGECSAPPDVNPRYDQTFIGRLYEP